MKNEEVRERVRALLDHGVARSEVFSNLTAQGACEKDVASGIASHLDAATVQRYRAKVRLLVGLMIVLAAIGFVLGYLIGEQIGGIVGVGLGIVMAGIALLFAWGFVVGGVAVYNGFIWLSLSQAPVLLMDLFSHPGPGIVAASAVGGGMLAYVWHVRECLFPDFGLLGPKKADGRYVFQA